MQYTEIMHKDANSCQTTVGITDALPATIKAVSEGANHMSQIN